MHLWVLLKPETSSLLLLRANKINSKQLILTQYYVITDEKKKQKTNKPLKVY